MTIDAICACKLFKASTRKPAILAAIQDPVNAELVQQLLDNISEESIEELSELHKDREIDEKELNDTQKHVKKSSSDADDVKPTKPSIKPSKFSSSPSHKSFDEKYDLSNELKDEEDRNAAEVELEPENVEEGTAVAGERIVANQNICDIAEDSSILLGTLNADESTAGAVRIQVKSDELWIFYADNINLNTVMEAVIHKLNSLSYTMLEFNRLARTVNAVVFTINEIESNILTDAELSEEVKSSD